MPKEAHEEAAKHHEAAAKSIPTLICSCSMA